MAKIIFFIIAMTSFSDAFAMQFALTAKDLIQFIFFPPEPTDVEVVQTILSTQNISRSKAKNLALICLNNPALCVGKNIFTRIKQDDLRVGKKDFAYEIFFHIDEDESYRILLMEALSEDSFDPHRTNNESDLALEILLGDDKSLQKLLIAGPRFNPNNRYGEGATLHMILAQKQKLSSLRLIAHHDLFDINKANYQGRKTGYYLLANKRSKIFRRLYTADFSTRGLGLYNRRHLSFFLRKVFDNNEQRLEAFVKIITQNLIPIEGRTAHMNIQDAMIRLLMPRGQRTEEFFIDKAFTAAAIDILVDFELLPEPIGDMQHFDAWFLSNSNDLFLANIRDIEAAFFKHRSEAEGGCPICYEDKEILFASSFYCDHVACRECWLRYFTEQKNNGRFAFNCLMQNCPFSFPPSLFYALARKFLDEDKFDELAQLYQDYALARERIRRNAFMNIEDIAECPHENCRRKLIINSNSQRVRLVRCPYCKNKFLIDPVSQKNSSEQREDFVMALVDVDKFITVGQCSSCKIMVDKIAGCNTIDCAYCKRQTSWQQLSTQNF